VNKKFSYHRQNVVSVVKHMNTIPSANICYFYAYTSLDWPEA